MYRIVGLLIALALAGCGGKENIIEVPKEVKSELLLYVPVPKELVDQHPVAVGTIAEMPEVASQRREELEGCNADKAETGRIQGTPVDLNEYCPRVCSCPAKPAEHH